MNKIYFLLIFLITTNVFSQNDFNNLIKNIEFDGNGEKSLATSTPTKLIYSKVENTLYIGSIGSGLFKYDVNLEVFENLNVEDGMLSGNVYDFLQVSDKLFFQSGTGINFIDKQDIDNANKLGYKIKLLGVSELSLIHIS